MTAAVRACRRAGGLRGRGSALQLIKYQFAMLLEYAERVENRLRQLRGMARGERAREDYALAGGMGLHFGDVPVGLGKMLLFLSAMHVPGHPESAAAPPADLLIGRQLPGLVGLTSTAWIVVASLSGRGYVRAARLLLGEFVTSSAARRSRGRARRARSGRSADRVRSARSQFDDRAHAICALENVSASFD
jgi:hypothetical protein